MKIRLLLSLAGLTLSFAVPSFAQQTNTPDPQLREQLLAFVTKYEEAINNGDAAAAAASFAEDGVLVNDTGPVYGQKAIEKYYAGVFQNVHFSNYIITVDQSFPQIIGKAGDEAWSTGSWSSTVRGQNLGPVEQKGYWSVIDAREGDARKMRMLTWNMAPVPPAPAQTNTAPTSGQEQKAVDPEVRQQIEAVMMKFDEAYNKYDAPAIAARYTQDGGELWAWWPSVVALASGRPAVEKRFAALFAQRPVEVADKLVEVSAIGNEICAIADVSAGAWKGHSVTIYVRDADTWKVRMSYANDRAQQKSAVEPEVRQQIDAIFVKLYEAYNKHDAAAIGALFRQDAIEVINGLPPGRECGFWSGGH